MIKSYPCRENLQDQSERRCRPTAKRRKNEITEEEIVSKFREIAFSEETKDSDRLRALDWLAAYVEKRSGNEEVMKKLDEVLEFLRS